METRDISSPERHGQGPTTRRLRTACAIQLLALLAAWLPAVAQAQFLHTTNNGTVTITGYTGPGGDVSIPDTINGWPVTRIGGGAFYGRSNLTSVTIPDSVVSLGNSAFSRCIRLTNAVMSGGITNIGNIAFSGCTNLMSVVIPSTVSSIGGSAFSDCTRLTGINVPSSVTIIWDGAFSGCTRLATITVDGGNSAYSSVDGVLFDKSRTELIQCPGGKTGNYIIPTNTSRIVFRAFHACTSLTSITIPTSITSIDYDMFSGCTSLTAITVDGGNPAYASVDGVLFDKSRTTLIRCPEGRGEDYAIPSGVTNIWIFAFRRCFKLSRVTIPNSVTRIESRAFDGCTSLTAINVEVDNSNYSSVGGVLFDKNRTTLIQYPLGITGNYAIPSSVTNVGFNAFRGCFNLTSIAIPSSVISIEFYAFYDCTNLTSVTIPGSVTSIEDGTFFGCSGLTNVTIPNGVIRIRSNAFSGCTGLTKVIIPASLTSIAGNAFSGCISLNAVCFQGNSPLAGSSVFTGADVATIYYLPGTTGWGPTFGGRPTALWLPQVSTSDASFGVRTNQFGFNTHWASGRAVVVEACEDLANPVWTPAGTNTLTEGSSYFSDPHWTNSPARFYRLRQE